MNNQAPEPPETYTRHDGAERRHVLFSLSEDKAAEMWQGLRDDAKRRNLGKVEKELYLALTKRLTKTALLIKQNDGESSNSGLLGGEGELHLARWYSRPGGWAFSLLEAINFDTGNDWALLAVVYDKHDGFKITVAT